MSTHPKNKIFPKIRQKIVLDKNSNTPFNGPLKDQHFLKFSLDYPKGLSNNGCFSSEKSPFSKSNFSL
jgi:hypothetical protein